MSKLSPQDQFLDLSDYARPFGKLLAQQLQNSRFTPVHVTLTFGLAGLVAIYCILTHQYYWAGFFIILKSGIDAADGELARLKKTPSYFGRYLDSVFDIFLNLMLLWAICIVTNNNILMAFLAFICMQLQGTLYNYYYVIVRTKSIGGDATSKIFELKTPKALVGESQKSVDIMFGIYKALYGLFDRLIYFIDPQAPKIKSFPKWFMTLLSLYGLGFQLLIISVMLSFNCIDYIIPFLITYTSLILLLLGIRKSLITA